MSRRALGVAPEVLWGPTRGLGLGRGVWLKAGRLGPREMSRGQRPDWLGSPGVSLTVGHKHTSPPPTPSQELVTVCSDARYML